MHLHILLYNNHLFTFGNNDRTEYDHVLTSKADFNIKQTLDYMWEIIPDYELNIYNKGFYRLNEISTQQKENNINSKNNLNEELSVFYLIIFF